MEPLSVERSVWIGAPVERVWQAVTDPDQVAQWLLPPALGAGMKRDDSGTVFVSMGGMDIPFAILEAVEPPRQFTSRSLPDRLLATTYLLAEEKEGTRLTVRMSGFESLPEDARQDRLSPTGASWEKALENLKAYIDGRELPYPEGYVAALSGFRREAKQKYAIERSIWIDVPRERVWRALTDPEQVQQWFSPGTAWEVSALEAGGRMYVRDPETGGELYVQIFDVFDPPRRLVMHSEPEPPEVSHVTTYTLEEENGGTRLTLTDSGYELEPEDRRWSSMEQNAFGYGMMLENLKAHLEGRSLPTPGGF